MTRLPALAILVAATSPALAYTVNSGHDAGARTYAEAKARNFQGYGTRQGYELSMARDNSGGGSFVPAQNVVDFVYGPKYSVGANAFTLTYNGVAGTLDFQLVGEATHNVAQLSMNPAEAINYLQFSVVDRKSTADVRVTGLTLNGDLLGDFGAEGWNTWWVGDSALAGGFTLSGNLVLSGNFANTSDENSKLVMVLGTSDLVAPVPLPSAAGLAALGLVATGGSRRRRVC